ncbi:hypothetical protein B0H63DRAFT_14022 [Podospora didyma]|uniref:Uncharacterized protein n=1 Tax=Podospora didyma TaxID=330526 RepID=A0AAE0U6W9_9PEZI|nr:hypothetical protein B0H63DRAFT_14022 [Podospora didyma]
MPTVLGGCSITTLLLLTSMTCVSVSLQLLLIISPSATLLKHGVLIAETLNPILLILFPHWFSITRSRLFLGRVRFGTFRYLFKIRRAGRKGLAKWGTPPHRLSPPPPAAATT